MVNLKYMMSAQLTHTVIFQYSIITNKLQPPLCRMVVWWFGLLATSLGQAMHAGQLGLATPLWVGTVSRQWRRQDLLRGGARTSVSEKVEA